MPQDLLDVLDEAQVEHLVGLVEDDVAGRGEDQRAARHQVHHRGRRCRRRPGRRARSWACWDADRRAAEDGDDVDVEVRRRRRAGAWVTWMQSSRVGVRTTACTSSFVGVDGTGAAAGRRRRSCRCPVWAWPITSWPSSSSGIACSWIGVSSRAELVERLLDPRRKAQVLEGYFSLRARLCSSGRIQWSSLPVVRRAMMPSWARAASLSG